MQTVPPKHYFVQVLGCKVNQYDARQIEELMERYGLAAAPGAELADLVVVHTCGVTAAAGLKSRQAIRRVQRDNPLARVFVTGCAANEELTQVDQEPVCRVPAGADWLRRLAEALDGFLEPEQPLAGGIETDAFAIAGYGDHTRAFLKVQDGCDIGCSFCIVPQLRKEPRDKPIAAAVAEAASLAAAGYAEIVVTGVSVGLYGRGNGSSLARLLERLIEVPGIGRIRLSSLHPGELTDELLEVWASSGKVMPHLHLSLQSGSDAVLAAMRRGYTTRDYLSAVERARTYLDMPAFTTDIIVGFPGEKEAYFEETFAFCREIGFSRMHTFTFSPRPGTIAARMPRKVNGTVAARRAERLRELGDELSAEYHRKFIGREEEVLVEQDKEGSATGYSRHYIPITFPTDLPMRKQIVKVLVGQASADGARGRRVD